MTSAFYDTLAQVGATMVSILSTLFVGYLLYIKERKDRINDEMKRLHEKMTSTFCDILETTIPGIVPRLLEKTKPDEKWDNLSLVRSDALFPWERMIRIKKIKPSDLLDEVDKGLRDLIKGLLSGVPKIEDRSSLVSWRDAFIELEKNRDLLIEWETDFLEKSKHIEFFCHRYGRYSWADAFLNNMEEYIAQGHNAFYDPRQISVLFSRLLDLRSLATNNLLLEQSHKNLAVEKVVSHYRFVITGFAFMSVSSVIVPLIMILLAPSDLDYSVSWISFLVFAFSTVLTLWLLYKSATR